MDIYWNAQSLKVLRRMPKNDAKRIRSKLHQYAMKPDSLSNVIKKLQGRDGYRLRVGDWRVIFTADGVVLRVLRIGPRGEIYK